MIGKKLTRAKTPRTIPTRAQLAAALVMAVAASSAHADEGATKGASKKAPSKTGQKKLPPAPPPAPPVGPPPQTLGGVPPYPSDPWPTSDAGAPVPPSSAQDGGVRSVATLTVVAPPEDARDAGPTGSPPLLVDGIPYPLNEAIELTPGGHRIRTSGPGRQTREQYVEMSAGSHTELAYADLVRECAYRQPLGGVPPQTHARGCCGTSQSAYASHVDLRALAGMACALALATGRRRTKPKR